VWETAPKYLEWSAARWYFVHSAMPRCQRQGLTLIDRILRLMQSLTTLFHRHRASPVFYELVRRYEAASHVQRQQPPVWMVGGGGQVLTEQRHQARLVPRMLLQLGMPQRWCACHNPSQVCQRTPGRQMLENPVEFPTHGPARCGALWDFGPASLKQQRNREEP
jgi:hypothetical protein